VQQLDAFSARFGGALGGDQEAAFVQGLASLRAGPYGQTHRGGTRGSRAELLRTRVGGLPDQRDWETAGLWLTIFLGLYQGALMLLHLVSVNVLGYTVLLLCVALLLLLGFGSIGREPLAITPEWARRWADPSRKARAWTATYRFIVPAVIVTIVVTVLTMLVRS